MPGTPRYCLAVGPGGGDETVVLVVPCFNEASRLPTDCLVELDAAGIGLVLVDDGSTDGTRLILERWATGRDQVTVHVLDRNEGKGEAVRIGLLVAMTRRPT